MQTISFCKYGTQTYIYTVSICVSSIVDTVYKYTYMCVYNTNRHMYECIILSSSFVYQSECQPQVRYILTGPWLDAGTRERSQISR